VASGERSAPGIPGPIEDLPVYEGQLLHAIINMRTWPEYVYRMGYDLHLMNTAADIQEVATSIGTKLQFGKLPRFKEHRNGKIRCVTLIRDPLSRLRSLYTYARSGGEHWFRYQSGIMRELSDPSMTIKQSLETFWEKFGRGYLLQSHEFMYMNIQLGCVPIKIESFSVNFTNTIQHILEVYGLNERGASTVLKRLMSSDVSTKSIEERRRDAHVTDNKFSLVFVEEVKSLLMLMPDVRDLVVLHRKQLGYLPIANEK